MRKREIPRILICVWAIWYESFVLMIWTNLSILPTLLFGLNFSTISDDDIPSKRRRTAMELLQTETSYLRNLNTIIKVS